MERLKQRLQLAKDALNTLDDALKMEPSTIVRDGSIQRFEFSVEACWKLAQMYLDKKEGLAHNSPKSVIRACFQVGILNEQETENALTMIADRNLTVHTYNEQLAEDIFEHLPAYHQLLTLWLGGIERRLS